MTPGVSGHHPSSIMFVASFVILYPSHPPLTAQLGLPLAWLTNGVTSAVRSTGKGGGANEYPIPTPPRHECLLPFASRWCHTRIVYAIYGVDHRIKGAAVTLSHARVGRRRDGPEKKKVSGGVVEASDAAVAVAIRKSLCVMAITLRQAKRTVLLVVADLGGTRGPYMYSAVQKYEDEQPQRKEVPLPRVPKAQKLSKASVACELLGRGAPRVANDIEHEGGLYGAARVIKMRTGAMRATVYISSFGRCVMGFSLPREGGGIMAYANAGQASTALARTQSHGRGHYSPTVPMALQSLAIT
ncbi:hypothetical protein BJY52DRAFT_1220340 [Lactarius psammicola]|nr:hypothetical protein BJY52DRAFT_1220340 [Lactarius psammicola]